MDNGDMIDDIFFGFLLGKIASLKYHSFDVALRRIEKANSKRVRLTEEWMFAFDEKKGCFCVFRQDHPNQIIPVCPVQDPPCRHYTSIGIACPDHPPCTEVHKGGELSSGSSAQGNRVNKVPFLVSSATDASFVIREILGELKSKLGIEGSIGNSQVFRKVILGLKNSTPSSFHSRELGFTVVMGDRNKHKIPATIRENDRLLSLLYLDDNSSLIFYGCSISGCFNIGTEVDMMHYQCQTHFSGPFPSISSLQTRNWLVLALDMLLETLFGDGGITPFKATDKEWMKMLKKLNGFGTRGINVPFAGTFLQISIGNFKKTLTYVIRGALEKSSNINRLCVAPFCLRDAVANSDLPFCIRCACTEKFETYSIDVLKKQDYGSYYVEVSTDKQVWLSDL